MIGDPLLRVPRSGDAEALLALYNHRGAASRRGFRALGGETTDLAACQRAVDAATASPRTTCDIVAFTDLESAAPRCIGWGFVWKLREPEPLFGLLVADDHQGKGLGRKLAQAALAGTDAAGIPVVHLTVVTDNAPAIRLYTSLGFARIGDAFRHDDGLDYYRMQRRRQVVSA